MSRFWLAFTTPPQKEREAQKLLREQGITAFVPVIEVPARNRGRSGSRKPTVHPVMPGYVFVAFPAWQKYRYHVAKETKFIRGVILVDGKPGRISHDVMSDFVIGLSKGRAKPTQFQLQKGAKVAVKKGKFAELTGTVLYANANKAKILVELFGRSCETLVDVAQLEELIVASTKVAAKDRKRLQQGANQVRQKSGRRVADSHPPV